MIHWSPPLSERPGLSRPSSFSPPRVSLVQKKRGCHSGLRPGIHLPWMGEVAIAWPFASGAWTRARAFSRPRPFLALATRRSGGGGNVLCAPVGFR